MSDVFDAEMLDRFMARLRKPVPSRIPKFDPEAMPAGWRRRRPGEVHHGLVVAENTRTGQGEWLCYDPPPLDAP